MGPVQSATMDITIFQPHTLSARHVFEVIPNILCQGSNIDALSYIYSQYSSMCSSNDVPFGTFVEGIEIGQIAGSETEPIISSDQKTKFNSELVISDEEPFASTEIVLLKALNEYEQEFPGRLLSYKCEQDISKTKEEEVIEYRQTISDDRSSFSELKLSDLKKQPEVNEQSPKDNEVNR